MNTTIAITLGDLNGIGPEVSLKAVGRRWPSSYRFVLVGAPRVLAQQAAAFGFRTPPAWHPEQGRPSQKVVVWDPDGNRRFSWRPGRISAAASSAASAWITAAVEGCRAGIFHGMVTAPICKEGFHKAGITVPGHTEMLAHLTRTKSFAMMLMGGPLRVVLATRHVPLAKVPAGLNRNVVAEAIRLTSESLPWLGSRRRRIGVCGLNPHAGEGGDLGREEMDIIGPAIRAAARRGINVAGPVPSDVIFYQAIHGAYDAVVAMYHDQGLGPLKMLAFDKGINLTLGLPIVRTSPDHGTAFDIAGKGVANPGSMVEAIKLAAKLARKKNPWKR